MVIEVLVVENNTEDAELIARALLKTTPSASIQLAQNGTAALDWLFGTGIHVNRTSAPVPRLILISLALPNNGGVEVLRILKSYARTRTIPIVLLTSPSVRLAVLQAAQHFQLSANSTISKSGDRAEFARAISLAGAYWLTVDQSSNVTGNPPPDDKHSQV